MKSKVIIVLLSGWAWRVYDFNEKELVLVTSAKKWAVDKALEYKSQGYRIHVVENSEEYEKALQGDKKALKKVTAELKGLFDHAHLRFKKIKVIK